MATHGSIAAFVPGKEDWSLYVERVKYYFAANDVASDAKKRSILLSVCGDSTFKLIRSLKSAAELETSSFDDITKAVKDYYNPTPSKIVQRWKFNTRERKPDESIATYVGALRELAENCEYGDALSEMLRDRLVCGVNHDTIQQRLLAEKTLDYTKAFDLAQAIESSERDNRTLKNSRAPKDTSHDLRYIDRRPPANSKGRNAVSKSGTAGISCYRCGGDHLAPDCKFIDAECHLCKKKGHIARVCRSKEKPQGQAKKKPFPTKNHYMQDDLPDDEAYSMFTMSDQRYKPIFVDVLINDVPISMELDTGAALSVISHATYQNIVQKSRIPVLEKSEVKLKTYTGEEVNILGSAKVDVRYHNQNIHLQVQVVDGAGPNLMGRDWMSMFCLTVHNLDQHDTLKEVLQKHAVVFTEEVGCMQGQLVQIHVDKKVKPKFLRPRTVPLALKEKVELELEKLESMGIISPVQYSNWAAPIVPVLKRNGTVRICGDYKTTVNQAAIIESYPLPRVEQLFANLSGGKCFTKLDMSQAYLQLPLTDESKEYVTINTHKGLFKYNRLPFGVSSAPAIFQRTMETLLQGIQGVSVYLDDILITGSDNKSHLENLEQVLNRLESAKLRLNKTKCSFMQPRIEYLGHIIDDKGLHPTEKKIKAIKEAPRPENITQLRSFLGILNYYSKFLPNISAKLTPLYSLLAKNTRWFWSAEQEKSFILAKEALQKDSLLVHYDSSRALVLACDASQYGLGAVLSHIMDDGSERPIAYVSRTLNSAEKKYSQLEKEALAIIFGVTKFHHYLYGRHFQIESDHKPLAYLFNETRAIPQMASSRIQRWALTLSAYRYSIRHKAGKSLNNADALSRLPQQITTSEENCCPADLVLVMNQLSTTTVNAERIKDWTEKDPVLSQVKRFILLGWPDKKLGEEFTPFTSKGKELSIEDGCILWGSRVIIPPQGRKQILQELHETHPGISKMKALARSYIWWPKSDSEIEKMVKTCCICQQSRPAPPTAPLHPWEWPPRPWSRLHLDFAGPYLGHMYLVIVDAHSKWLDVHIMQSITSAKTIEKLRTVFAIHGLPQKVVTDNGPSFVSAEFKQFMSGNGIKHVTSSPYHPSSNGLAERAVQSFKQGIKLTPGNSIQEKLSKYLFKYRITPHSTTGIAPAELLMNRRLRSKLDLVYPDVAERVGTRQLKQKLTHDNGNPVRNLYIGDKVYVRNLPNSDPKWLAGTVTKVTGPLSYHVELLDGTIVRKHVDHLRSRDTNHTATEQTATTPRAPLAGPLSVPYTCTPVADAAEAEPPPPRDPPREMPPPPRRSTRSRQPPDRYS